MGRYKLPKVVDLTQLILGSLVLRIYLLVVRHRNEAVGEQAFDDCVHV